MRLLRRADEALSVLLGVALFAVLIWQVVTRYLLGDPSAYTEEAARYLYVGVVFFGAAAAVGDRSHIGMPFLVERLSPGPRLAVSLLTQALTLAFCAAIILWGWRAAAREWDLPSMAMEIPTGLVLAIIPAAATIMAIRTLACMAEDVRAFRRGEVLTASAARDF